MRILSQDGLPFVDAPYQNTILHMSSDGKEIYATDYMRYPKIRAIIIFAKYSTEDKAKKAIELMHKKYKTVVQYLNHKSDIIPPKIFQFPTEEELDNILAKEDTEN